MSQEKPAKLSASWEAQVVHLLAEQVAIPTDQLAGFLRCDVEAAERVVDHLEAAGLVHRKILCANQRPWVWASEAGGRLAAVGLEYTIPSRERAKELRFANETRLLATDLFPRAQWLSARVIEGGQAGVTPAGIVRSDDREIAVEIEPEPCSRGKLRARYERRRSQYRSEMREVLVLCCSSNVAPLEQLRSEHDWDDFLVRECPAFDGAVRRFERRSVRSRGTKTREMPEHSGISPALIPLVDIDVAELPAEALLAIQKVEGSRTPPKAALVGRRIGSGSPRWRVTTDSDVWRVTKWRDIWTAQLASDAERSQDLLPRGLKWRRAAAYSGALPLVQVPVASLPDGAVQAIQHAEASHLAPEATLVGKWLGRGAFLRFRVTTEKEVWRVTRSKRGWRAVPAKGQERTQEFLLSELQPQGAGVSEVLARPDGPGCRTLTMEGKAWHLSPSRGAWPSENEKSGHKARSPRASKSIRRRRGHDRPRRPLVRIGVADLPAEALREIQKAEASPSRPKVTEVCKRRGRGFACFRVSTDANTWRLSHNHLGWNVRIADESERAEKALQPPPPKLRNELFAEVDVSDIPEAVLAAVRNAEGTEPELASAAQRIESTCPCWRVGTETQIWRVTKWRGKWNARPADTPERNQKVLPSRAQGGWHHSLFEVAVSDLPEEALVAIQEAEGAPRLPKASLAAKRGGGGYCRFRITTDAGVWRVTRFGTRWKAVPADSRERALEVLPSPVPEKRPSSEPLLVQVDVADVPVEALQAVKDAEGITGTPMVRFAAKRRSSGHPRFRITTEREVWRVLRFGKSWRIRPADEQEREEEALPLEPQRVLPKERQPLVPCAIAEIPRDALLAIQRAEGGNEPPKVRLVAKRKGKGSLRLRVTTAWGVWRVTRNQIKWCVRPADKTERAEKVLPLPL